MHTIQVWDKTFVSCITKEVIENKIKEMAVQISDDYAGRYPIFLAVLNGSFIFAADLFKQITIDAEISFIKLTSYKGTSSSGKIITAIGLETDLARRHVILLEDIIDTGTTLYHFLPQLQEKQPLSLKIVTFLFKPDALQYPVQADYCGFEIPDKFVVGYGLDYNGKGRNFPAIYQEEE